MVFQTTMQFGALALKMKVAEEVEEGKEGHRELMPQMEATT